jgi:SAM-dependent methyltransferase
MRKNKKCYLCNQNKTQKAFVKLGWNIRKCVHCKLYSLDFEGSYQDFIKNYYNKKFFTGSNKRAGYCNYEGDRAAEKRNMRNYLTGILRYKKKGKLLDVGCATGLFMDEAEKKGFTVYGIDVSEYAVSIAKKRFGKRVIRSSIEKAKHQNRKYEVITMFDVLEHLNDPRKVLLKLRDVLKKDGLLVINTGDTDSFIAKLQGEHWHFFIPPQHFFYFSQKNLYDLLDQVGFKVIKVDRKGKWVSLRYLFHLAKQIQDDVIGHAGFTLIGNNFVGKIPIYLNLFDNITVYASKKKKASDNNN